MPQFTERPADRVVLEGQNVTFNCKVSGIPEPLTKWNFSGGSLPEHRNDNGTLTLYKVENTKEFEGRYTCTASNRAGLSFTNVSLVVDGEFLLAFFFSHITIISSPCSVHFSVLYCCGLIVFIKFLVLPRILSPLRDVIIQAGERLVLICNISADPAAQISWTKDDLSLPSKRIKLHNNNSTLVIESTVFDDDGKYSCLAWNRQGNASSSAIIEVQGTQSFCMVPDSIREYAIE